MNRLILIVGAIITLATLTKAQVVINEVGPSNTSAVIDNYGDTPDWVELYNKGTQSVNLLGYALSDDPFVSNKYVLPSVTIQPKEYLLVYLSGRNIVDAINHWESPVLESNSWKYIVPTSTTASTWNEVTFNDAAWNTGIGGIGYDDDDDATVITGPVTSLYMRTKFSVTDTSLIQAATFHMDYDDGFIAYINGVEIARANMGSSNYNSLADGNHEAVMYTGGKPDEFVLDVKKIRSLLIAGVNVLSIQVHNNVTTSSDMSARPFLSFGLKTAQTFWSSIPNFFNPPAGSIDIHTNFSLDNGKEGIILFNAQGTPLDGINPPAVLTDMSYGRQTDGATTFKMFLPSTPKASNAGGTAFDGIWTDVVSFTIDGGFYTTKQTVSLSAVNAQSVIRYTKDGSKPTASSTVYTGAISVDSTMVLRAAAFRTGYISKLVTTNSYIIGAANNPKLPVMSISTDPAGFFSSATGIYVKGPNASGVAPNYGANYWEDWEREIHFEYFDENDQLGIEQDCGVKIFGGWSRDQAMKSLRLIGKDEYGDKDFDYKFFKNRKNTSFRQLVLRNSGNDFNNTHFRDALNHMAIKDVTNLDYMEYQPVVVFINGQYWGIHNLRERINDNYVEDNHGIDNDDINLIENAGAGVERAKNGDAVDWLATVDFITNSDLTNAAIYAQVKQMLDIPNVIDFFASETYHINWDSPHNNVRVWRPKDKSKGWRYLYFDTDFGLNLFGGYSGKTAPSYNELERVITDDRSSHSIIIKKLLTNPEFKCQFANRYADLMNTVYKAANYKAVADSIKSLLSSDMTKHFTKWGSSTTGWNYNIGEVTSFIDAREAYVRGDLKSELTGLGVDRTLTVNVLPAGAGKVVINTVSPKTYSWSGAYFSGCPVSATIVPAQGYKFNNWTGLSTSSTENVTLTLAANGTLTANFVVDNNPPKITISEINYNSPNDTLDAGDWIELYNYGTTDVLVAGWTFKDANDYNGYVIPAGTTIKKGERLVIAADMVKFPLIHSITNVKGPLGFKLSSSGEEIRLYDNYNRLYQSVTYNNKAPWSEIADGNGGTLELLNPNGNINDPLNWFGGCLGGSPGKAYTECPCESPFLGEDKYLCETGGSIQLNSGLTATGRTFTWYVNGDKQVETTPTFNATVEGLYSVLMKSKTCVKESFVTVKNNVTIDLGQGFNLCTPSEATLTIGAALTNTTYNWLRNNVSLGVTSPAIKITTPGTYQVDVKKGLCTKVSSSVVVTSSTPTPTNVTKCGGGSVTLNVAGSSTYNWFAASTGGNSLKTGSSYTTTVSNTTTFYVEDAQYFAFNGGASSPSFGDTWGQDNFADYKLRFVVNKACYLNYVTVYPQGSSSITIRITSGVNTGVVHSVTVPATSSPQRVYLGKYLATGSYYMDAVGTNGELTMNNEKAVYPYEDGGGYISVTRMEPSWASSTNKWYFFFYNFEVANSPVQEKCDRTPVTAYTCETPTVNVATNVTSIKEGERVTFNSTVSGVYNSISWDFGASASPRYASGVGPHAIVYNTRGVYDVKITVSNNVDNYVIVKNGLVTVCKTPSQIVLTSDKTEYCGIAINLTATALSGYKYAWYQDNVPTGAATLNASTKQVMNIADYHVLVTDPYNESLCSATSNSVFISNCILSTSKASISGLAMYPNPTRNTVSFTGVDGVVEIRDMRGVLLITEQSTQQSIDVSSLKQGVYLVNVKSETEDHLFRLIKE